MYRDSSEDESNPSKGELHLIPDSSEDESVPPPRQKTLPSKGKGKGRKDLHLRKFCPVRGCRAGPQLRLAWHIKQDHPGIAKAQRLHLTQSAKVVRHKVLSQPPKGTPTITSLFAKKAAKSARPVATTQLFQKGTRHFPTFPTEKMGGFIEFLRGLDGGRKKESEVRQIVADVNKFLKFARRKAEDPVWMDILDDGKVTEYLDQLEKT